MAQVIGDVATAEIFDDAGTGKRIQRANVSANECGSTAPAMAGNFSISPVKFSRRHAVSAFINKRPPVH